VKTRRMRSSDVSVSVSRRSNSDRILRWYSLGSIGPKHLGRRCRGSAAESPSAPSPSSPDFRHFASYGVKPPHLPTVDEHTPTVRTCRP
jgi:hypothetical protein